ncbi:MAG TPA: acyltransferase [Gemmatimonadaceae bacterium]|nr:acyltransferase [Gemmatimonadaceae bacterium]
MTEKELQPGKELQSEFGQYEPPPDATTSPVRPRRYMVQLDGLRAIAVGLVMTYHWIRPAIPINLGDLGVDLFFVLSGFLITGILLDARPDANAGAEASADASAGVTPGAERRSLWKSARSFYIRRFLRIFPIYYGTLALTYIAGFVLVRATVGWHLAYLSNVLLARPGDWYYIAHLWSLSVEEQFYLVWPWVILLLPKRALLPTIGTLIAIAPMWRIATHQLGLQVAGALPVSNFDLLGLGALLAVLQWLAFQQSAGEKKSAHSGWLGATALVGLAAYAIIHFTILGQSEYVQSLGRTGEALVLVWIVSRASLGFGGMTGAALSWAPVVYVGRISYGIYLYHNFMGAIVLALSTHFTFLVAVRHNLALSTLTRLTMTLALASASWYLFEKPINSLKKRFA